MKVLINSNCRKGKTPESFIPARIAHDKIPQQLIAFYESRLQVS
jgi:hypothetical protein